MINAIVYCEGAFNTPNGKTANGLIRFTKRYRILSVIDSRYHGLDSGKILNGADNCIPVIKDIDTAYMTAKKSGINPECLIIGLAPDGGRLSFSDRGAVKKAINLHLDIHSGLHDHLSDDMEFRILAEKHHVKIIDIRKPPDISKLHFFSGRIEQVDCLKIAVLGTDSAIGKRTTAWILANKLAERGLKAEMVGTGQTAWLQGARYTIVMDSIINDFVSGEIENTVYSAFIGARPDIIIIEGQGSLMNPAYPGGFEIIAAARPDKIILQHAPMRKFYDGFPSYPLHPIEKQIELINLLAGEKIIAITINHENIDKEDITGICEKLEKRLKIPVIDPLCGGADRLTDITVEIFEKGRG